MEHVPAGDGFHPVIEFGHDSRGGGVGADGAAGEPVFGQGEVETQNMIAVLGDKGGAVTENQREQVALGNIGGEVLP